MSNRVRDFQRRSAAKLRLFEVTPEVAGRQRLTDMEALRLAAVAGSYERQLLCRLDTLRDKNGIACLCYCAGDRVDTGLFTRQRAGASQVVVNLESVNAKTAQRHKAGAIRTKIVNDDSDAYIAKLSKLLKRPVRTIEQSFTHFYLDDRRVNLQFFQNRDNGVREIRSNQLFFGQVD